MKTRSILILILYSAGVFAATSPAVAQPTATCTDADGNIVNARCLLEYEIPNDIDPAGEEPDTAVDPKAGAEVQKEQQADAVANEYSDADLPRCPFDPIWGDVDVSLMSIDLIAERRVCPEDENGEPEGAPSFTEIAAMVSTAYLSLPIAPSVINHQPGGDWALINVDFNVYVDPTPQQLDGEIAGMTINFKATPVHYSWDFGDGCEPLPTSEPGAPHPNRDVTHIYEQSNEGVTISLTTTWQGSFQINGEGPWYPVANTVTTTSTVGPIELVAMDVNLVPGDN